jgi:putative ABC transport system permease protein
MAALVRLYPRDYRERYAADLAAAMQACVERERLAGANRLLTAMHIAGDALSSSFLIRRDRRAARETLGGSRAAPPGDALMRSILHDIRYACRQLVRAPLFSALVVTTLALAIGANTAIFSVVNGVLLRSLPYAEPDRLVALYEVIGSNPPFGFGAPDFTAFRERARSFDGIAAFRSVEYELSGVDQPERIPGARISASLLDVLGVRPALGRAFTVEEDTAREPVAILGDALWRRRFGADPAVVGKAIILDRRTYTIVGVMPAHFTFPNRGPAMNNVPAQVYVPIAFSPAQLSAFGSSYNNSIVGRLKAGVTIDQARGETPAVIKQVGEIYPAELRELSQILRITVTPLREDIVGNVRRILYVLLGAVGVVLLIACANIACLMLTRAAAREREMAIRTALGAGRWRVIRLILVETGVLTVVGAAAGLTLAWWGQRSLLGAAPITVPRAGEVAFDLRVLAFTLLVSAAATLVCGLFPALESSRRETEHSLKEGGRSSTLSVRQRRVFAGLVTAQFACALVLVAAGGLLIRSVLKLASTDPGFSTDRAISVAVSLPFSGYPTGANVRSFYTGLLERVGQLPGVTAAGAATDLPLTVRDRRAFTIENPSPAALAQSGAVSADTVVGRYFEALGVRVVRGRALSEVDTPASEPVVVVNETLAKRYWPGEEAVGRRVAWGGPRNHGPWMRVAGVIGDVKQSGLAAAIEPQVWQPWAQLPDQMLGSTAVGIFRGMKLMVRTQVPTASLVPAIREEVRRLDPALPLTGVQTLDEIVGASAASQRFNAMLLGGFAGLALLLAGVGIGGVLAISVSRRTQEIGIRLALGANAGEVVRMVIRQGLTMVAAGLAIGLPCAFAATHLLRTLLFETAPHDAVAFAAALVILCAVALVGCAAPAVRASRVSPMTALRID